MARKKLRVIQSPTGHIFADPNTCTHDDIENQSCKICGYSLNELREHGKRGKNSMTAEAYSLISKVKT